MTWQNVNRHLPKVSYFLVHNEAHNTKRDSTYRLTARIEPISIGAHHQATAHRRSVSPTRGAYIPRDDPVCASIS